LKRSRVCPRKKKAAWGQLEEVEGLRGISEILSVNGSVGIFYQKKALETGIKRYIAK